MIRELEERLEDFEFARHELIEVVTGLDDDSFNRQPDEKCWSMDRC